jgi:hypothetical protein
MQNTLTVKCVEALLVVNRVVQLGVELLSLFTSFDSAVIVVKLHRRTDHEGPQRE